MEPQRKTLKQNVYVDGVWYGPDYPASIATAEILDRVSNPAAFESPVEGNDGFDLRNTRADLGLGDDEEVPTIGGTARNPSGVDPAISADGDAGGGGEFDAGDETAKARKSTGRR